MDIKILFHDRFHEPDYAADGASIPGRLEAIMTVLGSGGEFEIVRPPTPTGK
jgi:hypothetical protein